MALLLIAAGAALAGCGTPGTKSGDATPLTGHLADGNEYLVPLAYCTSPRLDQSQLNLTTCAAEEASGVGTRLSRALATESTYYSSKAIASVQASWSRFASSECSLEVRGYLGGSAYDMLAAECIQGLETSRLQQVDATLATLRLQQIPTYRAGTFPVDVTMPHNSAP